MIEHTPLDVTVLSAAAQKALGAGPGRMMASRGLVPLPPSDQISVLYQLAIDRDSNLAQAARTTAMSLPDKLLAGALGDGAVDSRVLDLFAQLHSDKAFAFDALVENPSIADSTVAYLAQTGGAREVDRVAVNEQRLLRYPEIIAAMYQNKYARMSTVDRVVELAVRHNVRVPGLAAWDEIARAIQAHPDSSPETDALFAAAAAAANAADDKLTKGDANQPLADDADKLPEEAQEIPIDKLSVPAKMRLCVLGNGFHRAALIRDPLKLVAMAAIKSPAVTEFEAARYAANPNLGEDVIRYIATKREWTKDYGMKYALCKNPKTPVAAAMTMLLHLRERELVNLSKSKGVSQAVVTQAKKVLMQRRTGDKKS